MEAENPDVFNKEAQFSTESAMEGKDGRIFSRSFYNVAEGTTLGDIPELKRAFPDIIRIAVASFPHWSDNGEYFSNNVLSRSRTASIIKDSDGTIVGFNLYALGQVEVDNDHLNFMYANYSGVDPAVDQEGKPKYRRNGLMERSRAADLQTVSPDVLVGCSSVGEIHFAIEALSKETGRVKYPSDLEVPHVIGELGAKVYGMVNGAGEEGSVDKSTLVRHGKSPYAKGVADYPLFRKLNVGPNDGVIYLSVTRALNDRLDAEQ